jgi:hypothetical protein
MEMMETQAMDSLPVAEFLDMIKERYEGSGNPTVYKIVQILARYDGSTSVICYTEIVWKYDDLCVKMFDLDVSGWEISEEITCEWQNSIFGNNFNVVTIRMTRMI